MTVGLTSEQEEACRIAIMPIPLSRSRTAMEACASMSTVLPLVVIIDETMPRSEREAMSEFITACGAELVPLEHGLAGKALAKRLLDAIVVAERRRMGSL
jgi:hypothetical protein